MKSHRCSLISLRPTIYRTDSPPGPAGRWFIDRLKQAQTLHAH
jgi:hypothetical protein